MKANIKDPDMDGDDDTVKGTSDPDAASDKLTPVGSTPTIFGFDTLGDVSED